MTVVSFKCHNEGDDEFEMVVVHYFSVLLFSTDI